MNGTPDLSAYTSQANAVRQNYGAQSAANTFAQTLSQQRGARNQADFTQGFSRSLPTFTSGFAQRGLGGAGINSGVMRGAMRDYVGDYTRDLGRMQQDNQSATTQYQMNQAGFDAERDRALADIHAQKQAMIAQTANHISGLSPYLTWS